MFLTIGKRIWQNRKSTFSVRIIWMWNNTWERLAVKHYLDWAITTSADHVVTWFEWFLNHAQSCPTHITEIPAYYSSSLAVVALQRKMTVFSGSFVQRFWERNGTNVNDLPCWLNSSCALSRSQFFVSHRELPQHLHRTAHASKWRGSSWSKRSEQSYLYW